MKKRFRPSAQQKYRESQAEKGLVRFEMQVDAKTKEQFDKLVSEIAESYDEPWDKRKRLAKARAKVFNDITSGIRYEFTELNDKIRILEAKIAALSNSIPSLESNSDQSITHKISSLPDNPQKLKLILQNVYKQARESALEVLKYKKQAKQFEDLYEAWQAKAQELE